MYCHSHKHFLPSATHMLILLFTFFCLSLQAATIAVDGTDGSVVNDGVCSISEAIINANDDVQTHSDCVAGSGADTINLGADITLTTEYENNPSFGRTGTPAVTTAIVLDGQGHVLERDSSLSCNTDGVSDVGEFRLLRVANNGNLELQNTVIRGGCVDGNGGATPDGGGIVNNQGTLSLLNTVIDGNQARGFGGGVSSNTGDIDGINNTTFSNNISGSFGGGLSQWGGNISVISNSTFSNNSADNGGAISLEFANLSVINNSTFSGNTALNGLAILNYNSSINEAINNLFHNGSNCVNIDGVFNGNNNLADATSGAGCTGVLATTLTATTVGPLADNGCTTPLADGSCVMTHALLPGSEALDMAVGGTATDQRGFNADGTRDIGAYEAQIPVISAPADIIVEATGPSTITPPLGTAVATDADSDDLALSITNDAVASYAVGVYTVTWTVTDNHGFQNTDTQSVTIQDTTPPVLSLIGTTPVNLNVGDSYIDAGATATDLVDDDVILTANIVTNNPVNTNIAGSYTVTYNVSDNAGNAASQITRTVQVNAYPQVQLSSTAIDFGGVLIGQNDTVVITVSNTGNASLTINSLGALAAPFAVTGGSCTPLPMVVPTSASCTFEISYTPTTPGNVNGQLTIHSNAPDTPALVALNGYGYAPASPVPTLSLWNLMLLCGLMFICGLLYHGKLNC